MPKTRPVPSSHMANEASQMLAEQETKRPIHTDTYIQPPENGKVTSETQTPFQKWLNNKSLSTKKSYVYWLMRLFHLMNTDADQIVVDAKVMHDEHHNIDDLWTKTKTAADHLPENGKNIALFALRSYIRKQGFYPPSDKIVDRKREKNVGYINANQVHTIITNSDPPFNLIFLLMFRSYMGGKEFLTFNTQETWNKIRNALATSEKQYYRHDYAYRKRNNLPFYALIPRPTLQTILDSGVPLPFQTSRGIILDMTHYLNSIIYIQNAFRAAAVRANIQTESGDPPTPHHLRDAAITFASLNRPKADDKAVEFAAGHTIDPLGYRQCWRDETWMWEELSKVQTNLQAKGL